MFATISTIKLTKTEEPSFKNELETDGVSLTSFALIECFLPLRDLQSSYPLQILGQADKQFHCVRFTRNLQ